MCDINLNEVNLWFSQSNPNWLALCSSSVVSHLSQDLRWVRHRWNHISLLIVIIVMIKTGLQSHSVFLHVSIDHVELFLCLSFECHCVSCHVGLSILSLMNRVLVWHMESLGSWHGLGGGLARRYGCGCLVDLLVDISVVWVTQLLKRYAFLQAKRHRREVIIVPDVLWFSWTMLGTHCRCFIKDDLLRKFDSSGGSLWTQDSLLVILVAIVLFFELIYLVDGWWSIQKQQNGQSQIQDQSRKYLLFAKLHVEASILLINLLQHVSFVLSSMELCLLGCRAKLTCLSATLWVPHLMLSKRQFLWACQLLFESFRLY